MEKICLILALYKLSENKGNSLKLSNIFASLGVIFVLNQIDAAIIHDDKKDTKLETPKPVVTPTPPAAPALVKPPPVTLPPQPVRAAPPPQARPAQPAPQIRSVPPSAPPPQARPAQPAPQIKSTPSPPQIRSAPSVSPPQLRSQPPQIRQTPPSLQTQPKIVSPSQVMQNLKRESRSAPTPSMSRIDRQTPSLQAPQIRVPSEKGIRQNLREKIQNFKSQRQTPTFQKDLKTQVNETKKTAAPLERRQRSEAYTPSLSIPDRRKTDLQDRNFLREPGDQTRDNLNKWREGKQERKGSVTPRHQEGHSKDSLDKVWSERKDREGSVTPRQNGQPRDNLDRSWRKDRGENQQVKERIQRQKRHWKDNPYKDRSDNEFRPKFQRQINEDRDEARRANRRIRDHRPELNNWFGNNFFERHHYHPHYYVDNSWYSPSWQVINVFFGWGGLTPIYYEQGYPIYISSYQNYVEVAPQTPPPVVDNWLPLGVFAVAENVDEASSSNMFIQLAVNKDEVIGGTYYNATLDQTIPIDGVIDRETQQAFWWLADNPEGLLMYTGLFNLTLDVVPIQSNYPDGTEQSWVLVKLSENG